MEYHSSILMAVYRSLTFKFASIEIFIGKCIDEGIKTFVHPGIFSFVTAYNHWEPVMTKLVRCYTPKSFLFSSVTAEYNPRIFHSCNDSRYISGNRIGVF